MNSIDYSYRPEAFRVMLADTRTIKRQRFSQKKPVEESTEDDLTKPPKGDRRSRDSRHKGMKDHPCLWAVNSPGYRSGEVEIAGYA